MQLRYTVQGLHTNHMHENFIIIIIISSSINCCGQLPACVLPWTDRMGRMACASLLPSLLCLNLLRLATHTTPTHPHTHKRHCNPSC